MKEKKDQRHSIELSVLKKKKKKLKKSSTSFSCLKKFRNFVFCSHTLFFFASNVSNIIPGQMQSQYVIVRLW